jgi:succinate dehydrogenase/fumarate reductase flavoprotein subunit
MAGLCAAISSASNLSKTMIVTKTLIGGANTTSMALGVISAVTKYGIEGDSFDKHVMDTLKGGVGVNDKALVRAMVNDVPKYMDRLIEYGVEFDGGETPAPRFVPGHSFSRGYLMKGGGAKLQSILRKYVDVLGIELLERTTITNLVKSGDRVVGAVGYKADTGDVVGMKANSVVLATGGPGELYSRTLNPIGSTGYGGGLGLKAGAEVVDMEFVQFYPMMVSEVGLPKIFLDYPPLMKNGATVVNSQGDDVMKKRGIAEPFKLTRDAFSIIVSQEMRSSFGELPIFLDCTKVGTATLDDALASNIMKSLEGRGVPAKTRKFGISPYAHFFMGGLKTDPDGATNVPGLFATGEAMGGVHGANRIGGNALAACLVFGFRAGLASSLYASTVDRAAEEPFIEPSSWIREALNFEGPATSDLGAIRGNIQNIMLGRVGILRNMKGLEEAMAKFNSYRGTVYKSKDPLEGLLLPLMLDTAEVICLGAMLRDESRGSHYREDAPEPKTDWEKRIVLKLCEGKCEVRYDSN